MNLFLGKRRDRRVDSRAKGGKDRDIESDRQRGRQRKGRETDTEFKARTLFDLLVAPFVLIKYLDSLCVILPLKQLVGIDSSKIPSQESERERFFNRDLHLEQALFCTRGD